MLKKFQGLAQNKNLLRVMSFCMVFACVLCIFVVSAFAVDPSTASTPQEAASEIFSTVSSSINIGTIVSIIGIALGAGVGLYLAWWALRKVVRMVKGGLNGKLNP